MSKNVYCGNCGAYGHIYRRCLEPITSLGIILFKWNNDNIEYLLIQRKDTLGFVEFMRGKYNLENTTYIYNIFKIMTKEERLRILENDFDTLWNNLWMNKNTKQYHNEYDNSKKKFIKLKDGIEVNNEIITLNIINDKVPYVYLEPEWGFPKGRRNLKESDIDCAIREFEEETSIESENYTLLDMPRISETFLGTNNIRYKHIYYIAKANNDILPILDFDNYNQISEISNVKWFNYTDAFNSIREYNKEKRNVLTQLNEKLLNL